MTDRLAQLSNHLTQPPDPTRLDGQVVLITGAAQGIGRATAELLASKGAKIAINDLDEKRANAAVEALQAAGHEAFCYCGDVLDVTFPPRLIKAVLERFGRINVLVNSAGMKTAPVMQGSGTKAVQDF
ncbi:putative oxidoreductase [Lachnellula occidentalis]|uniref:Putative oxidoreductase n=1 Tax=Lachnellula occidentalis TaxID=215460 RepID=A0A8H8S490_9HELO|nr:putative oxidoreductase [Lachnellula occidentalis]